MPGSYTTFDADITAWVWRNIPPLARILDVGPGRGKYGRLLRPTHPRIDAIEVWPKYVDEFRIREVYREVFIGDARTFDFGAHASGGQAYELVIFGDVIEHLSIPDAQAIIARAKRAIVQVPYMLPQGVFEGNSAEIHLQPDLTHELVLARYPSLRPIAVPHIHAGAYAKYAPGDIP